MAAGAEKGQYVAFMKPLSKEACERHALDRLSFGGRPGDLGELRKVGLKKWLNLELHPERVVENPELATRLEPLESLRLSIHDTYTHYPPPQMIRAIARGNASLPGDAELRAVVQRLAERYEVKKQAVSNSEDPEPEPKIKLTQILSAQQIEILKTGKPEEKRQVLESIPAAKRLDFAYALRQPQRQALLAVAPVELRRELMLAQNPQSVVTNDLSEGKILRAVYSNHQLEELLVDFWFNHFNVFINKGSDRFLVPTYERESIRPFVFGKFYDLLLATAKSPAMLFYLDNAESMGANSQADLNPGKKSRGLNENYGRELLELHTLGVDGGYTQQDVINVARCFTGWTIAPPRNGSGFEYNDKMHDKGEKVVLGHKIAAGGGMNDGLEVLQLLARHPATAHFVSLKLAKRFVADEPPPALVNRMAKTFLQTDGDLRKVMQTMIQSREFWSQGAYEAKVKMPFEMVVSALRATGADVTSAFVLSNTIQQLGEPLYRKVEPTGYSSANAEWVNSAALLARMNFALSLAGNHIAGVQVDENAWQQMVQQDPMALARLLLEKEPSAGTHDAIEKAISDSDLQKQIMQNAKAGPLRLPGLVAGLTLGSPEFQKR